MATIDFTLDHLTDSILATQAIVMDGQTPTSATATHPTIATYHVSLEDFTAAFKHNMDPQDMADPFPSSDERYYMDAAQLKLGAGLASNVASCRINPANALASGTGVELEGHNQVTGAITAYPDILRLVKHDHYRRVATAAFGTSAGADLWDNDNALLSDLVAQGELVAGRVDAKFQAIDIAVGTHADLATDVCGNKYLTNATTSNAGAVNEGATSENLVRSVMRQIKQQQPTRLATLGAADDESGKRSVPFVAGDTLNFLVTVKDNARVLLDGGANGTVYPTGAAPLAAITYRMRLVLKSAADNDDNPIPNDTDSNTNAGKGNQSVVRYLASNQDPVATAASVSTAYETAITITLAGTDPEDVALTFAIATQGSKGVVTMVNANASATTGTVLYTPAAGESGADSFTFTVTDGVNVSAAAAITITVDAEPVAETLNLTSGNIFLTVNTNNASNNLVTKFIGGDDTLVDRLNGSWGGQDSTGDSIVSATNVQALLDLLNGNLLTWPTVNGWSSNYSTDGTAGYVADTPQYQLGYFEANATQTQYKIRAGKSHLNGEGTGIYNGDQGGTTAADANIEIQITNDANWGQLPSEIPITEPYSLLRCTVHLKNGNPGGPINGSYINVGDHGVRAIANTN